MNNLIDNFDANDWANAFIEIQGDRLEELDVDIMRAWFANAIMTGFDIGSRQSRKAALNEVLIDCEKISHRLYMDTAAWSGARDCVNAITVKLRGFE